MKPHTYFAHSSAGEAGGGKLYISIPLRQGMDIVTCDSKGRVSLKQALRRRYGERFITVSAPGEILLIPVPKDPVADLRAATAKARGMSLAQLQSVIERQARRQVVR